MKDRFIINNVVKIMKNRSKTFLMNRSIGIIGFAVNVSRSYL